MVAVTMIRCWLFMLPCSSSLGFWLSAAVSQKTLVLASIEDIRSSHSIFSLLGAVNPLEAAALPDLLCTDAFLSITTFPEAIHLLCWVPGLRLCSIWSPGLPADRF